MATQFQGTRVDDCCSPLVAAEYKAHAEELNEHGVTQMLIAARAQSRPPRRERAPEPMPVSCEGFELIGSLVVQELLALGLEEDH